MIQAREEPRDPLGEEQLFRLRSLLIEERTKLRDILQRLYGEAVQDNPENLGDATVRTHLADLATEAFEQSSDLGLAEQTSRMIQEIDRALERMEQASYGYCETCAKPIPVERLEAIPSASRCAACQSKREKGELS